MKFEHHVSAMVPKEMLWALLSDFQKAARCLPGVEEVRQADDNSYQGTMRIRIGPIGLNLSGTVELEQDEVEGLWRMRAQARDGKTGGGVRAIIEAILTEPKPGSSDLRISADVQFMGRLGELGQPLIKRKANTILQEFAENLKKAVTEGG